MRLLKTSTGDTRSCIIICQGYTKNLLLSMITLNPFHIDHTRGQK